MTARRAHRCTGKTVLTAVAAALLAVCGWAALSAPALAAGGPSWSITADAAPSSFPPDSAGSTPINPIVTANTIIVEARNLGNVSIDGSVSPITVSIGSLPGVVTATEIVGRVFGFTSEGQPWAIPSEGSDSLSCVQPAGPCTYGGVLAPGRVIRVELGVSAGAELGGGTATANVSGGADQTTAGAVEMATVGLPVTVSSTPAPFGIQPGSLIAEFNDSDGSSFTQAGGHPYALTVAFSLNSEIPPCNNAVELCSANPLVPSATVKDVIVDLPPGVAGNQLAVPQCSPVGLSGASCPGSSQVGASHVAVAGIGVATQPAIFNVQPENGHTNELGLVPLGALPIHLVNSVRTDSDYGIRSTTARIPQSPAELLGQSLQVWGTPADPTHDYLRVLQGWDASPSPVGEGGHSSGLPPTSFLTMPSQCGVPLQFKVILDSYEHPGRLDPATGGPDLSDPNWKVSTVTGPAMTGCELLQSFHPKLTVAPDTSQSDTPTGVTVDLTVPQGQGLTDPNSLATPTLQDTKVTLPQGLAINPGQADGLAACQYAQDGVGTTGPPSCPAASRVGAVEISTPLLPDKLVGSVYVLQSNPPNLQLLVAVSADGVNVKLIGDVKLDPVTGRVTSTFSGTPELPFTEFKLAFSGGAHAALTTPLSCGLFATTADFTPWSSPATPDFNSANAFGIESGPGASACLLPLPFSPQLTAGATTDQAGGFTDFSLLLQRGDGQQRVSALQFNTPEGLLGMISKVPLCQEPAASQGACPAISQIGHTVVAAGPGPYPLIVPGPGTPPAPIYLTGGYKGAPYGLSIAVPVIAGPFNLGTVVVRSSIAVDPHTAQLTVTTDPLPLILDGIPTDLRTINAVIDRPSFMFNPTNCSPMSFAGTAVSDQGTTAALSSHFQVGSCQSLTFKPDFKVSTSGKTSKANGASLDARVIYPTTPLGANQASSQANIASVKVDLPKQLPSRLTTLQKACLAATFEANPAACPVASRIGVVRAITPVLPVPLTGPVYFVSHGGAAFPDLVIVLQGYGVRVDLIGNTFIAKNGVTSTTFKTVPDVPINSFELYLPEGHYSALAANGNLCKSKLAMPTAFTGQNGAVIHQNTLITVTGCPKVKHGKRTKGARKSARPKRA